MKAWDERPAEIANLFNPAFCALLLREGAVGFAQREPTGIPYPLLFVLLPIVLHRATREKLPSSTATKMHPWIEEHQEAKIGFSQRCSAVSAFTREAVIFALGSGLVSISPNATIQAAPSFRLKRLTWPTDSESAACRQRARFVGRWFAAAGEPATIFAMWGVRP
jgi:hypothetical protein